MFNAVVAIIAGTVCFYFTTRIAELHGKHSNAKAWPRVDGTITHVSRSISTGRRGGGGRVRLRYEFEVDGDTYWGTGLTVAGNEVGIWAGYDPYSALYEAFKEGAPVDVYYNPERRLEAVLYQLTPTQFLNRVAGYLFIVVPSFGIAVYTAWLALNPKALRLPADGPDTSEEPIET